MEKQSEIFVLSQVDRVLLSDLRANFENSFKILLKTERINFNSVSSQKINMLQRTVVKMLLTAIFIIRQSKLGDLNRQVYYHKYLLAEKDYGVLLLPQLTFDILTSPKSGHRLIFRRGMIRTFK